MASEAHAKAKPGGAALCNDPGRSLFYERVGQFFHDDSEVVAYEAPLPCIICGQALSAGALIDGRAICAPQRSIVAKRPGVSDPPATAGEPGAKAKRSSHAFNMQRKAVFITPDAAYAIASVRPLKPLPTDLKVWTEGSSETYGELYSVIFGKPHATPALYVEFEQSGAFEFDLTLSPDMLRRCGGSLVETIDAGRVREIVAVGRAIGQQGLRRFNQLRSRASRNDPLDEAESAELLDLMDRMAATGVDLADPPTPDEAAYGIAGAILRTEFARAQTTGGKP
jgi:hypothetical protein